MSLSLVSFTYWPLLAVRHRRSSHPFKTTFPFPWLLWHFTVLVLSQCHWLFSAPSLIYFTCPLNVNISQGSLHLCVLPSSYRLCILINAIPFSDSFRMVTLKSSKILSSPSFPFSILSPDLAFFSSSCWLHLCHFLRSLVTFIATVPF